MSAAPRFELNIDALVIEGAAPGPGLRQAVESELMRLLSADGALDDFASLQGGPLQLDLARVDAGALRGAHSGAALGVQLGRAIYKSLRALPSREHGSPQARPQSQSMKPGARPQTKQETKP